jgi:lactoylglutathione lyase
MSLRRLAGRDLIAAASATGTRIGEDRPMAAQARAIGINHVALEVGDIDEALRFYGSLLRFTLRGRIGDRMAFIDLGDQFIALSAGRRQSPDDGRHLGVVVDDAAAVRRALDELGVPLAGGRGLDFRDPWGNLVEVVQYDEVQFTKAPAVMRAMGLPAFGKSAAALAELRAKGVDA